MTWRYARLVALSCLAQSSTFSVKHGESEEKLHHIEKYSYLTCLTLFACAATLRADSVRGLGTLMVIRLVPRSGPGGVACRGSGSSHSVTSMISSSVKRHGEQLADRSGVRDDKS